MTTISAVIYRPRHQYQLVASDPHGPVNCSAYVLGMAIDAATVGGLYVTGKTVRALSNEPSPSPSSPGLNISQLVAVSKTLRVPIFDRTTGSWSDVEAALANAPKAPRVLAQITYAEMGSYRAPGSTFRGGHMILLHAIRRRNSRDEILYSDPLRKSGAWAPASVIRSAMDAFASDIVGLRFAVTRAIPDVAVVS